jgi:nicotinate (nicotinamide) nucleotide adenylyltransferase
MIKNKIAFYGAFNPPTWAHVHIAQNVQRQLSNTGNVVEIVFVPSRADYILKEQHKNLAFESYDRAVMLMRLCGVMKNMHVSIIDIAADHQPRTYESLCMLRNRGENCSLLIGADQLLTFETSWKNPDKILEEFGLVCVSRGDVNAHEIIEKSPLLQAHIDNIAVVDVLEKIKDISSTKIREILMRKTIDEKAMKELETLMPPMLIGYVMNSYERAIKGE